MQKNRSPWPSKASGAPIRMTLAWSAFDETLRLICTFEMEPPAEKLPKIVSNC